MSIYGIYGSHTTEMCPWNNLETGKIILGQIDRGMEKQAKKYKINRILGQYHSALEHTFLWIVDAEEPHLIQQFCVDEKVAAFNALTIVPLITFKEVVEGIKSIHSFHEIGH